MPPKNIILLADGTGNSSAKPFKTNVWRLYQALDIRTPPALAPGQTHQIVFYDNGVGTQNFRPLATLGLAFGVGLARNVKRLYTFLCRNYEPGDGIFLFGFSRGAFAVRILAGLILKCGLVVGGSEEELRALVELAYAEYKRDAARRATATRPLLVSGWVLGGNRRGRATDRVEISRAQLQHFPRISFIGVWDTVDAYGMPIDELKLAIDHHVWPMLLADRRLSPNVDRACHAMSLDDERPTFRPVLWTEQPGHPGLTQVWFAGVHANVGGGYPDDALAHHPLQWMLDEAIREGLRFYQADVDTVDARADVHGPQHDSRAGVAAYYRYGPRNVDALSADRKHDVQIAIPLVHRGVLTRLQTRQVPYSPVSFPTRPYDVVERVGRGLPLNRVPSPESPANRAARAADMRVTNVAITRRRMAYFVTVVLTVALAVFPLFDPGGPLARYVPLWAKVVSSLRAFSSAADGFVGPLATGTAWVLEMSTAVVPSWARQWMTAFSQHPTLFLVLALPLLWLFFKGSYDLQKEVYARAERAWRRL